MVTGLLDDQFPGKVYDTIFVAHSKIGLDTRMKGLILAGGFATRLRPLSCSKPKLLFPVVGTPLIDYMMKWLERGKVSQVVLAMNHLSDRLRTEVASRNLEERIVFSVESVPLGTGGPLRLAQPFFTERDPVLVVNGDVVSNIRIEGLIKDHLRSGAEATIAVYQVEDTRPFGLVTLDSENRIVGFAEKSETDTGRGWINAGVYLLNPSVIEMIPKGRPVSLEREIFPLLAMRRRMRCWKHDGFWYDIGKINDYVSANMELLDHHLEMFPTESDLSRQTTGVEQPSYVGADCVIGRGARIGPRSILSKNVKVKSGATVRGTILFEDVSLEENCKVENSVIGESTRIGKDAVIGAGSVIAGEVVIPDRMVVNPGSVILN